MRRTDHYKKEKKVISVMKDEFGEKSLKNLLD